MPPPKPKKPKLKALTRSDPAVQILGHYLQKNAEFEARMEMERLLEEAKKRRDDPPQRDLQI